MIRVILAFGFLFMLFFAGIQTIRQMTGRDQWQLVKTISYSILCSILSLAVLISIVVVF